MSTTISLPAATASDGGGVEEELLVESCGADTYRLLASPRPMMGVAAGDLIRIRAEGGYEIVERGGNLCLQIFSRNIGAIREFVAEALARVHGRLDGEASKVLVYTVPVGGGFPTVERAMASVVARFPDTEWMYGNVYDPVDGVTPLNWWDT